jgi:prepilin-type N-terminal cleavage/methylation domain-containing protein
MKKINFKNGFSLVELMVVISIIAVLTAIIYASFDGARKQSRDKSRMASLKELQLAVELYKAQNGTYPPSCGGSDSRFYGPGPSQGNYESCSEYIEDLVPDFIASLPLDPNMENESGKGFYYRSDGSSYKILVRASVESVLVSSPADEFARCPTSMCHGSQNDYAVYSAGAEQW